MTSENLKFDGTLFDGNGISEKGLSVLRAFGSEPFQLLKR